jgi:polysaccharide export outer membrane protein
MEVSRNLEHHVARWLLAPALLLLLTGCQTVRTPEELIAKSNLPIEKSMMSLPEYVVEPPDLLIVEVLEAAPGRPITGERLVRPDGTITLGFYGDVYVAGLTVREIKEKVIIHLRKHLKDDTLGLIGIDGDGNAIEIPPSESDRVFVDVAAYNSKWYYIEGDVAAPGRLPITGNETVLDALNFAGGFTPTAAPQNVRLVRPAPPGASEAQLLPVNYAAIVNAGDPTTNYQLLPGDRIVVYRDPIVRTTVLLNRLAEPFNTVVNSMLQYTFLTRYLSGNFFGNGGGSTTSGGSGNGTRRFLRPPSPAQ